MKQSYIPVSCDLVDQIEIFATSRKIIIVSYWSQNKSSIIQLKTKVTTWQTKDKEEFVVLANDIRIRMDHIIKLDNFSAGSHSCNIHS